MRIKKAICDDGAVCCVFCVLYSYNTETEVSSLTFWRNFRHSCIGNISFRCSQWQKFRQNDIFISMNIFEIICRIHNVYVDDGLP